MNPQEKQLLGDLLQKISQAPISQRDPEADAMIQSALAGRSDALYLLTQMTLINEISLQQAQQQIQQLQQQQKPAQSASILSGPWGAGASQQAPVQQTASAPSFLSSVLTTASGVIVGDMAFSALRGLFGGGGSSFGGGNSFLGSAPTETVVNNYYGQDSSNNSADDSSDFASDSDSGSDFSSDDFS